MRLINLHDSFYDYPNTNLTSFIVPGVEQQAADALLQLETDAIEESPFNDEIPVLAIERNLPVSPRATEDDYLACSICHD